MTLHRIHYFCSIFQNIPVNTGQPKTKSRVCIMVDNSPSPSSVYVRICKHRKKSFLLLLWNNFPEKKSKALLFRALIKREILTSREVLYTMLVRVIIPCFPKEMLSKIRVFLAWRCQLKQKKIDTACFWRFSKFQPRGNG